MSVDGRTMDVDARRLDARRLSLIVGRGASYDVGIVPDAATGMLPSGRRCGVHGGVQRPPAARPAPQIGIRARRGRSASWRRCRARSCAFAVAPGEAVRARQTVVVIEAMKMENELRASRDGIVGELHAREGALVVAGELLAVDPVKFLARLRAHWAVRFGFRAITLADRPARRGRIVASVTIDLGPSVRGLSERQASKFLKRDVRFGRLSIHLLRGRVLLEDFSIGGMAPGDRPFFVAKRLSLGLDWATAFRRVPEFTITSVEMTDWQMLVERWADRTNFPKFVRTTTGRRARGGSPRRCGICRAWRGQFAYEDHEVPWSVVAPNIDLDIAQPAEVPRERRVPRRHRADPERSADVGPTSRRSSSLDGSQGPSRAHRPRHRRRADRSRRAKSTSRTGPSRRIT